jgi:hypothetical protein
MGMQGEMKRYSDRIKKEQADGVLITEVKTGDRDADRGTVVKETNGLLIQYYVNCMTRLPNCFAQCLRGYYATVEKNCRSQYSFLLTTVLKLLRDFHEEILSASCRFLGPLLMMLQQTTYSDRFICSFCGNYTMIWDAILNILTDYYVNIDIFY